MTVGQLGWALGAWRGDQANAADTGKSAAKQKCDEAFCKAHRPRIWPGSISTDYNLIGAGLHEI